MGASRSGLTDKQRQFAEGVVELGDQSAAYRRAYNAQRMGAATVNEKASRLAAHPAVADYIARLRAEALERHKASVDEILVQLAEAIRVDPAVMHYDDWSIKPVSEIPASLRRLISAVKKKTRTKTFGKGDEAITEVEVEVTLELMDKLGSIEKLMKHLGMYEKDNKQRAASELLTGRGKDLAEAIAGASDAALLDRLAAMVPEDVDA